MKYRTDTTISQVRLAVDIATVSVNDSGLVPAERRAGALIFLQHAPPSTTGAAVDACRRRVRLKKVGKDAGALLLLIKKMRNGTCRGRIRGV